jgi:hypothetical protein
VAREDCASPLVDIMVVYGTPGFQVGHGYETLPLPEAAALVFQANIALAFKRKVSEGGPRPCVCDVYEPA